MTLKEIFVDRLLFLRHKNKYSQENIAQMLGMSASSYAKLEEGITRIHLEILEKIAKVFNVEVVYLLGHDCGNNA